MDQLNKQVQTKHRKHQIVCVWLNLNYGVSTVPNWPRREAKNGLSHVRFFGKHVRFFRYRVPFFDNVHVCIHYIERKTCTL